MNGVRTLPTTHYPLNLSNSITTNVAASQLGGTQPPSTNAACGGPSNTTPKAGSPWTLFTQTGTNGDGDADGDIDQFWQDRNYNLNVNNVHAAVFESHGLNDDNVRPNQMSQWWAGLTANNVPRKLWLHQEGHVDPFDYRRTVWVDTLHRWFDYWLQGVDNGIMNEPMVDIETGPGPSGVPATGTWETAASWPRPGTVPTDIYLQGNAAGVPGKMGITPGGNTASETFTDANLSETNYLAQTATQTNRLTFVSPVLTHPLSISGTAVIDIQASLSKPQTNLTAFLVDYGGGVTHVNRACTQAPSGCSEGVQTLSQRRTAGATASRRSAARRARRRRYSTTPATGMSARPRRRS